MKRHVDGVVKHSLRGVWAVALVRLCGLGVLGFNLLTENHAVPSRLAVGGEYLAL